MGGALVLVLALLFLSALLAAGHAAAFRIGTSHVRTLQEEGFPGSDSLSQVRAQAPSVGSSVRLVTRTLNLAALGIVVSTGSLSWGQGGTAVDVLLGIAFVLVLADIIPHSLAARQPVRLALWSAKGLLTLTRATRMVAAPVERLEDALIGRAEEEVSSQQRELREIQAIGQEEGIIEASESLLVERAFRLDELTAWDAMVPRVDIFAWREELTLTDVVGGLSEVPYSRVPVYRRSVDDVTGIVYVREILERYVAGEGDLPLHEVSHAPFFVPGSLSLAHLMEHFQSRRIHMGIVADEFGGTDGLVTLEDVLEELVGEIHDETDMDEEEIVRISDSQVDCDAGVDVRDLEEALGVELPKVEHRSLNGLILEELGHVPPQGASFERAGVHIEILEATETQVLRARLTKIGAATGEVDG